MFNCCSHGTLLHFSPQGSHSSICYYHQDLRQRRLQAGLRPTPSTLAAATLLLAGASARCPREAATLPRRPGMGSTLERHPFSGLVASAGELLHTP